MSVLNMLKKVKTKTLSFEKHPCNELNEEMKVHYLNALSLIMNANGEIDEKELEYLEILLLSFGFSKEKKEEFVAFAKAPDEDAVLAMIEAFPDRDIKYNLIMDAMIMASKDGNFSEIKKATIEQYYEMFKFTEQEPKELENLFEMFLAQDGNGLFRYFKHGGYLKQELFDYLLEYYKIDLEYELQEWEKGLLEFRFFKPISDRISYRMFDNSDEIMAKPINNAQFLLFLNEMLLKDAIEIDGLDMVVDSNTKDLLLDPEFSDIKYENGKFIVDTDKLENKVTGITYIVIEAFIEWLSKLQGVYYGLTHGLNRFGKTEIEVFKKNPIVNEIVRDGNGNNMYYAQVDEEKSVLKDSRIDKRYLSRTSSFRCIKLLSERVVGDLVFMAGEQKPLVEKELSLFDAISEMAE